MIGLLAAPLKVVKNENPYEPMKRNETLLGAFRANLTGLGAVESPEVHDRLGSSDVGNVSQVIPAIQPLVKIAPDGTATNARAFEAAARAPDGWGGMLIAAKGMAMTTVDLLDDPAVVAKGKQEFEGSR